MALVVYTHTSPFADSLQLDNRVFTFFNKPLNIKQRWSANGKGGTDIGFGASVYNGAIVLTYYLEQNPSEIKSTVIELGCGPGLVSIATSLSDSCQFILATDGDPLTIDLLNENIELNISNVHSNCRIHSQKLYWGNKDDIKCALSLLNEKNHHNNNKKEQQQFDLIIASDVAALPYAACCDELINTMYELCHPDGVVLLSYQRRHLREDDFFEKFQIKFNFTRLSMEESIHEDFRHLPTPICIFRATPR